MCRFQTVIKIEQIGISACGFLQRGPWVEIFSYARFQIAGWSGSTSTRLTKIRHSVTLILATRFSSAPKFFWRGGARFRGRWIDTVVEDMHLIVVQVHSRHSGGLEGDAQTMVENIFKSLSRVRIAAVFARASIIC